MQAKSDERVPYDKIPRWSLHSWLTFLGERAPPVIFLLLSAGPCLSGLIIGEGYVNKEKFAWALVGELVLLLLVRVMDDVKDYEKDKIVHPDRPLPRGLLRYEEVCTVINYTQFILLGFAVLMGVRFNWVIAILYTIQVAYTFLMYIEFGAGEWLEEKVFLYGLIHQLSIYFGAMFIVALAGAPWNSSQGFLMGSVGFSGFFTYEICRKLDPTLPKLKGTYLVVYGKWVTFGFTLAVISVGVVSSYAIGLNWLLWPLEGLMALSLLVLFILPGKSSKPKAHKPVEALSVIYLLVHMWSAFIASYF